jgi:GDPmannose 4,6-dehydratase
MHALIIGSAGQDGRILSAQLVADGGHHDVTGVDREADADRLATLVEEGQPSEIYYLAAHHQSSEEERANDLVREFSTSFEVHVQNLTVVLEAIRLRAPKARLFYASSSHVFGRSSSRPTQSEATPRRPDTTYAITKSAAMDVVRFYRETHGVHASCGILYNHESIYRPDKFVSMRLVRAAQRAADLSQRQREPVEIGSLSAIVDWGWAPDYTEAMQRIVRRDVPDDYVVATGVPHTVADFADAAFSSVGLAYRDHVVEKASIVKFDAGVPLIGDATKLRETTGWRPTISFEEMVARLVADA